MVIPIVFQAKAMTVRILISTAFLVVFAAILLVCFDGTTTIKVSSNIEIKNDTLVLGKEIQETLVILIPRGAIGPARFAFDGSGGGSYTGVPNGRIIWWRANESRRVDFTVTSPER